MTAATDSSFFGIQETLILTKNGVWLSNNQEIEHERTKLVFSRSIYRCKDGHEIRIGNEHKTFHLEDTMYFVTHLLGDPQLGYTLFLNDGRQVELDPKTLNYQPGRLTCRVEHPNENTNEEAKFLPTAYYEILQHSEQRGNMLGIQLGTHWAALDNTTTATSK